MSIDGVGTKPEAALLAAENVVFDHRSGSGGSVRAVNDVSLAVRSGQVLGVVGESGSGKSTLARCLVRLLKPAAGRVTFRGTDIARLRGRELTGYRRAVQMVFQDPYSSLNPRMTVEQIVGEGLTIHQPTADRAHRRDRVVSALEEVGIGADGLDRHPRAFSGGQRQRIAIARALVIEPDLLICDEPVSALDVSVQAQVINLLRRTQQRRDLAILFIAHDLAVVRALCDRVAVMHEGRVVEEGSRDEVYGQPREEYTRALLRAVPVPDPAVERARRADQRAGGAVDSR